MTSDEARKIVREAWEAHPKSSRGYPDAADYIVTALKALGLLKVEDTEKDDAGRS